MAQRSGQEGIVVAGAVFDAWLERLAGAFELSAPDDLAACFAPDGYWKDILSFTWGYRTFTGAAEIRDGFAAHLPATGPRGLRRAVERTPPRQVRRSARDVVEGYFDFDTDAGRGVGFVRLLLDAGDPLASRAWICLTTLQELRGVEERIGERRPTGLEYSTNFTGPNWLDQRVAAQRYDDRQPEVLVVGAGQAGLTLGAHLTHMGVDTLIVERHPRVGDNWRTRYHSLTLHNEVWSNHLPYMPFPPTWPAFVPKDKLAGWLEAYAEAMELNIWTGTELVGGTYDEDTKRWSAVLRRADGEERVVQVPHLVLASGSVSGVPNVPELPGLDAFAGEVVHSSAFTGGTAYSGRRAVVVGTGTSGHDVAQELHSNGAEVTMVQRSPTCVLSLVPGGTMIYAIYSEGLPIDDVDLVTAAIPYPVLCESYQWITRRTCELDKELLEGLEAAGFELDFGHDQTGFHMMYLRRGGGYYINVGCSELIASGAIGLVQARDIEAFTATGARCREGRSVDADLVVLATGYRNQQESVRCLLGDQIADKVGPIWGFDANHMMRNMWQPTAQQGLWFMGGSLIDCRLYSRFLALQLAASLRGVLSDRAPAHTARLVR